MAEGITPRHTASCPARQGGRCRCDSGYQAWVYSPRDAKKIYKTFARESEAKSWRADAKRALDQGTLRAPTKITWSEAAEAWLLGAEAGTIRNRSGEVYKPSTLRGYRRDFDEALLPLIGSEKLSAVTTADLQALVDGWQAEGIPASTIRNRIKPLQAVSRRARSRGGLALNATHDLELPAPRPKEVEILARDVAARLLEAVPSEDRPCWATALYAGLRYGELRALRWGAVDLAGGTIRVRKSWDPKEGEIDPKTRASRRTVPVPGVLRDVLLEHRLTVGAPAPEALVFGREDGRPFQAAVIYRRADRAWELAAVRQASLQHFGSCAPDGEEQSRRFVVALAQDGYSPKAIAAALSLKPAEVRRHLADLAAVESGGEGAGSTERLRLHQARHTYASFMIAAGVNAKALSTFMGHSSIKVTFDLYGHLMPGAEAEAAALLNGYLQAEVTDGQSAARQAASPSPGLQF